MKRTADTQTAYYPVTLISVQNFPVTLAAFPRYKFGRFVILCFANLDFFSDIKMVQYRESRYLKNARVVFDTNSEYACDLDRNCSTALVNITINRCSLT